MKQRQARQRIAARPTSQRGIGVIGILVFVLALAIVVFVVWRFYGPKDDAAVGSSTETPASNLSSQPPKTYTDSAGKFTFQYPVEWSVEIPPQEGKDGPVPPMPDWTVVSRPVFVRPSQTKSANGNDIQVRPGCSAESIATYKAGRDRFHSQQDLTINGHKAFYDRLDFKGDAESYLHHTYIIMEGENCVELGFRENWHHDMGGTNFDDSGNLAGFQRIVNSVSFKK